MVSIFLEIHMEARMIFTSFLLIFFVQIALIIIENEKF